MSCRGVLGVVLAAGLLAAAGCYEPIRDTRGGWERAAPNWVVKKPGEAPAAGPVREQAKEPTKEAAPVRFKPDTEFINPILEAKGNWTIRVWFFYGNPRKKRSALSYANDMARSLQGKGYTPYITDMLTKAIVTVGAWDEANDPELKRVWREMYDGWLETHRGKQSTFSKTMSQWYSKKTVFGDQPRPISILDLQMKMKGAYGIQPTPDELKRYKEYLAGQQKKMYGYDRFGN